MIRFCLRLLAVWLALVAVPVAVGAQGYPPVAWLDSPAAERYQDQRSALSQLFLTAQARGLPGDWLADKLREGAAKRVAPALLTTALAAEVDRLTFIAAALERLGRSKDAGALKTGSLVLQGGMERGTLEGILGYADTLQKSERRALEACAAAIRIGTVAGLEASQIGPLAECLVRSSLADSSLSSVAAVAVRARRAGITGPAFYRLMVATFDAGGGIPALDQELVRRGNR